MMHSYIGEERSVFGPMGDLFGFDDLSQIDPLAEANSKDVEAALRRVAQFRQLYKLAQGIQNSDVKAKAMAIVNTQWYKVGALSFLGFGGKYNLIQLADIVEGYARLPAQQFVYFNPDFSVNRTRENRLNSFVKGMREFEKFMGGIISLPTELRVTEKDSSPAALLALAQGKAQLARHSGSPQDALFAKAIAESARDAGEAAGNQTVVYAAEQLMYEMDKLVAQVKPGTRAAATGPDMNTLILWGGGIAAVLGIAYMATRK